MKEPKRVPRLATYVMIGICVTSGLIAYWSAHAENVWAAVLFSWFCGASGAHVNRDMNEHRLFDWMEAKLRLMDPMRNITVVEKASEYMCPNCVTPWKCNHPHHTEDCKGWMNIRGTGFDEDRCSCGASDTL